MWYVKKKKPKTLGTQNSDIAKVLNRFCVQDKKQSLNYKNLEDAALPKTSKHGRKKKKYTVFCVAISHLTDKVFIAYYTCTSSKCTNPGQPSNRE